MKKTERAPVRLSVFSVFSVFSVLVKKPSRPGRYPDSGPAAGTVAAAHSAAAHATAAPTHPAATHATAATAHSTAPGAGHDREVIRTPGCPAAGRRPAAHRNHRDGLAW